MQGLLLLGALCATSLGVVFPFLWFLAPIGFGALLYLLIHRTTSTLQSFLFGYLFGIATSGAGIIWFFDSVPLDWIGVTNVALQYYMVASMWGLAALACGLATGLYAVIIFRLRTFWFLPLVAIPLFVIEEEVRMWFFSFITFGPESLVGPHFSAVLLSNVLAENSLLLQAAQLGGVRTLSAVFILIALVGVYAVMYQKKLRALLGTSIVLLILLGILATIPVPTHTGTMRTIALVATNIPIESFEPRDPLVSFTRITNEGRSPSIIVFPEGHGLEELFPEQKARTALLRQAFPNQEALIVSSTYSANQGVGGKAELTYESVTQGVLAQYKKVFLMPEGEYSPFITAFFLKAAQSPEVTGYLKRIERPIVRGTEMVSVSYAGLTLGGMLCSDALSPVLVQDLAAQGTDTFIAMSNNSWFHHSRSLHAKVLQIAKIHAVEHRAYYLAASNGTPSFALDPQGNVFAQSAWGESTILYVDVPVR